MRKQRKRTREAGGEARGREGEVENHAGGGASGGTQ